MRVGEIMTRGAECTYPDATVREAAVRMQALDVGVLPVRDNDRLVGMLTDRDLTIRTTAAGADPNAAHVRDAMTPEVHFCYEDQEASAAARQMKDWQVRRLPVLDRSMRVVGVISLGDLAVETRDDRLAGNTLEAIAEPARPNR